MGEMNHSQRKKQIICIQSTKALENPITIKNLPIVIGGAKTQNKIEAILIIPKDPLSKIFLLLFFLSFF